MQMGKELSRQSENHREEAAKFTREKTITTLGA